jgi:large subunit ribosomal protein L32
MAVPKRRHSTGRKGRRRSVIKIKPPALILCPNCQQPKKPHRACPNCGFYKGSQVTKEKEKAKKKS